MLFADSSEILLHQKAHKKKIVKSSLIIGASKDNNLMLRSFCGVNCEIARISSDVSMFNHKSTVTEADKKKKKNRTSLIFGRWKDLKHGTALLGSNG